MMKQKSDWIVGLILGIILLLFILIFSFGLSGLSEDPESVDLVGKDKIAIVELRGIIYDSHDIIRQFKKYQKDKSVKAILLRIESPGGGVAASQEIYQEVKKIHRSGKIIVVSMGSVAASGGYYVACPADTILANAGTITGSIGVIAEFPQYKNLFDKIGVGYEVIKSGKYKDTGSPFRPFTKEDREYLQGVINSSYNQFIEAVSQARNIPLDRVKSFADGRIFTGEQARELGLVDKLGTYQDAIALTGKMAGLGPEPKIVKEKRRELTLFNLFFGDLEENLLRLHSLSFPQLKYQLPF